jgi:outer membrane protein
MSSWLTAGVCRLLLSLAGAPVESGASFPELPVDPEITGPIAFPSEDDEALGIAPGTPTIGLAQAVATALHHNFNILSGADAVLSARLRESASRSQFYPKITPVFRRGIASNGGPIPRTYSLEATQRVPWLGGTFSAVGNLTTQPQLNDPLRDRASDIRFSLTQPLLRGFGPTATFADLTASRRARESQERSFVIARQSLTVEVVSSFYEVIKQRQLLTVARQSLERNETLLRASQARMEAGLASKLDVYRAELQVSYAQDAMVTSETQLMSALENFRVLLGLRPTDAIEPAGEILDEDFVFELDPLPVLVQRALAHRLELLESQAQVDDLRRSASLAKQNLLPQLDVTVGVNRSGFGPSFGDSLRAMDNRFDVFFSTSYPIERASDRAQKAVADIGVAAGRRALVQRELEVEAEVRAAVRNIDRIGKSVELQKKGVELALQQHRLATLRYQRGIASNFDVVEAEDKLVSARAALVSLLTDYRVARVRLLKVTGTLDVEQEFRP